MRRFALMLVALGCVLLGVTVVVATRPDRAPARIVRAPLAVLRPATAVPPPARALLWPAPAVLRRSPVPGARPVPMLPLMPPQPVPARPLLRRAPRAFAVPGGPCEVAAGGCSLHPCVTYAGAAPLTPVPSSAVVAVLPQAVARLKPAPNAIVPVPGGTGPTRHPCVASAPAQRLVTARITGSG